jgi:small-conductance mechanosensitive channel/CRP-like cAMP-binding protein
MNAGATLWAEVWEDRVPHLLALVIVLLGVTRSLAPEQHRRLRGSMVLFCLYLALVPIAAALRAADSAVQREVRLAALIFATLSVVGMVGTLAFSALLPRLRVLVPRILQDVLVAAASLIAIFVLASRAGLNLSGLIATSAVLTAVIGLAFQDTLGNVVGGLALQLDNSIKVGDWVKVGDVNGKVTEIRWRYTAIETRNWETVIIPNSQIVKGQVSVLGRRIGQPVLWRRWVYFNVDFRYEPSDVIDAVIAALRGEAIENVAAEPAPNCILIDLHESYCRYAVRYWLKDLAVDDPTDSIVRTRIYFALRRVGIPLSIPAHAIFMTEDSSERRAEKTQKDLARRIAALRRVELFASLSDEERARLADGLRVAPFTRGETITRQGAVAHWLYVISEGEAAVRVRVEGGIEREVARLAAGDFFGEMSLLTGERRAATVVAVTDVDCYRLDKAEFQKLLERRPELAEGLADVLAKRRLELSAVKEDLDAESRHERLRVTRTDLVGKIRTFFALEDERNSSPGP